MPLVPLTKGSFRASPILIKKISSSSIMGLCAKDNAETEGKTSITLIRYSLPSPYENSPESRWSKFQPQWSSLVGEVECNSSYKLISWEERQAYCFHFHILKAVAIHSSWTTSHSSSTSGDSKPTPTEPAATPLTTVSHVPYHTSSPPSSWSLYIMQY